MSTDAATLARTTPVLGDFPRTIDQARGRMGMICFIATEAMLFLMLFFAYFYLGHDVQHWPPEPPKLHLALTMLAVLIASSVVLRWGEHRVKAGEVASARAALLVTILLGVAFLVLQVFEYGDRLEHVQPTTSVYGSIFYAITSLHGAHVALGILMLAFVLMLPHIGETNRPPHKPMHTAAMYWHFVDIVWVFIVVFLYVLPNVHR